LYNYNFEILPIYRKKDIVSYNVYYISKEEDDKKIFEKGDYVKIVSGRLLDEFKRSELDGHIIDIKFNFNEITYLVRLKSGELFFQKKENIVKINKDEYDKIDSGEFDGTENEISLDKSTYQLYYNEKIIEEFIDRIVEIFNKKYFKIDLDTIKNYFNEYTLFEIITGLRKIINDNKIINNRYGFPCYLKENNNIYFLVDTLTVESNYYSEYYTQNPLIEIKKPFIKIINNIFVKESPKIIKYIFSITDIKKIKETIYKLPLEIIEMILENSIIANEKDIKAKKLQRELILEIFKNDYKKIEREDKTVIISSLLYTSKNILKCLELENIENGWKVCTQDYFKEYKTEVKKQKQKLVENQYGGYYGLHNRDLDIFCIKKPDVGLKNKTSGSVCEGPAWTVSSLIKLVITIFKLPLPDEKISDSEIKNNKKYHNELKKLDREDLVNKIKDNKTTKDIYTEEELNEFEIEDLKRIYYWGNQQKKPICHYLKKWLDEQNLVINDSTCGTSFKEIIEKEEKPKKEKKSKKEKEEKPKKEKKPKKE